MNKIKIGKNSYGWFVSFPRWWGGYDVMTDLASFEEAWVIANQWLRARYL